MRVLSHRSVPLRKVAVGRLLGRVDLVLVIHAVLVTRRRLWGIEASLEEG